MTRLPRLAAAALALLLAPLFPAPPLSAAAAAAAAADDAAADDQLRTAHVTYFTGSTVYLDAGTDDGLRPGLELTLRRGDQVVAVLEVKDASTHRASCAIVEQTLEPAVGDEARYLPVSPPEPSAEAAPGASAGGAVVATTEGTSAAARRRPGPRGPGIRGRVGLRYLASVDHINDDGGYSQPALDLRLDGANLGGSAWGFSVDARARRLYYEASDRADENRTRVYRLAAMRRGVQDRWDLTVGRQFSPALSSVSVFDGISVDYRGQRWAAGLMSGTQPDPEDYGYSDQIREHGVYFQYHGRPADQRSWQLTTGLVGSYDDSEPNREFLYLQGRYNDRRLALFLAQEVDFNRGWKKEEGQDAVSPTSTFLSLRYQVTRRFELHTGYDNRRNVRLYRDRVTPITEFDDAFRRGVWAGAAFDLSRHYRLGLDARTNSGGDAGDAETYSAYFGAHGLGRARVNVDLRGTHYNNERVDGWLGALTAGANLSRRVYFQLYGGLRDEEDITLLPPGNTLTWYGLDLDVDLGRRWYLLLSAERTDGDYEELDQYYVTVSYRF